jgi:hypothetical protein
MRREMKVSVSIALSLMLGFILLSSPTAVSTAVAGVEPKSQISTEIQPNQGVIARIKVTNQQEMQGLVALGAEVLNQGKDDDFYILTTFEKLEALRQQGFPITLLYVRGLDYHGTWKSVEPAGGECTYTIDVTEKILTGEGGFGEFKLTTGANCEWVAFSDSPWLRINGNSQGTGPTVIESKIDMNPTAQNRIGHIFVQGNIYTIFQGATFADVPLGHPFYYEIGRLSARGITSGCGGPNYCPNETVARDQVAVFIIRSLGEFNPPVPPMQRFTDVPPESLYYNFVDRMADLGITSGCTATEYCPATGLSREQAAAFIIRALGELNPPTPPAQRFADVPPSSLYYNFIDRLAALQITKGCSENPPLYCPFNAVSRGQIAVLLVKAFDL